MWVFFHIYVAVKRKNIMTKKEKELILKDLCGRLQNQVIIYLHTSSGVEGSAIVLNSAIYGFIEDALNNSPYEIKEIKPYLRPISSMTEEEKEEIKCRWVFTEKCRDENDIADINNRGMVEICEISSFINWLISHHFDYNGLIPMGLALEAPEDMYKD